MLERIQGFADINGKLTSLQAFDADVIDDPVTGDKTRGPLRETVITEATHPKLFKELNDALSGKAKAKERTDAMKAKRQAEKEAAEAAEAAAKALPTTTQPS